jgi:radical SAM enzyme (TIGR01210 family)
MQEHRAAVFAFCILNFALRDHFVLHHRPPKKPVDPYRAYATAWEEEPDASGELISTSVLFLTNRECAFRCVMCDLWKNTVDDVVGAGAIPDQIRAALATLPPSRHVKLYNAGSFFDPQQIPADDDEEIARTVDRFERVIVESHPAFLSGVYATRCLEFQRRIAGRLEVAVGLETAHPDVLERLNKRMTVDTFRRAAEFLGSHDIGLRVFILLSPPFMPPAEAVEWACRSIDVAAECGATVCSVIPTRGGNGTMEAIGDAFVPPRLSALESVVEYGIGRGGLRVFADLWDIERVCSCECSSARAARLAAMNREQRVIDPVVCARDARH